MPASGPGTQLWYPPVPARLSSIFCTPLNEIFTSIWPASEAQSVEMRYVPACLTSTVTWTQSPGRTAPT